jgi:hypothetical protein
MATESGPDHDAFRIDGLVVLAVPLSGANRTEEAVLGENPHVLNLMPLLSLLGHLTHSASDSSPSVRHPEHHREYS